MATNKPNISTSGKNLFCINDNYVLPKDTFQNALGHAYEQGRKDSESISFSKAWSFLLSSAITLLITTISFAFTLDWKLMSTKILTLIFSILFLASFVVGVISFVTSKKSVDDMTKQRDASIDEIMANLNTKDKNDKQSL